MSEQKSEKPEGKPESRHEKYRFKCDACGEMLVGVSALNTHLKEVHKR